MQRAPLNEPMPHRHAGNAARVVVWYALAAATWILVSDFALGQVVPETEAGRPIQTLKGLAFVVVTSLLLLVLVRREFRARERAGAAMLRVGVQFEAVLNASPVAVYAADLQGRIMLWNAAAERIYGWAAKDLIGEPLPRLSPTGELEGVVQQVAAGHEVAGLEARHVRRDGKRVDMILSAAPLRDPAGTIEAVLLIGADVTERNKLAEQFRHAQKLEAVGRLAAAVAHDFNNILTVIKGEVDLALGSDEPAHDALRRIGTVAEHASDLTRKLLQFSRPQPLTAEPLAVNLVITGLEGILRRLVGVDIQVEIALDPGLKTVRVSRGDLEQVLMNLVVNARDAMSAGGRLRIATRRETLSDAGAGRRLLPAGGVWAVIVVADTGSGMSAEVQQHLFEPFYTTKAPGEGTGLGLATVYGIVRQAGGQIGVKSGVDSGATFEIYLPSSDAPSPVEVVPTAPPRGTKRTARILAVDDNPAVRAIVVKSLARAGYTVLEAGGGEEAIALLANGGSDVELVVTDIVMPGMSGMQLAEHVIKSQPTMRFLFTSGYTPEDVPATPIPAGAPFLEKPFTPAQLVSKVDEVLSAVASSG